MAMMMTGRVLLVCALCVLWCGAGGRCAEEKAGHGVQRDVSASGTPPLGSKELVTSPQETQELNDGPTDVNLKVPRESSSSLEEDDDDSEEEEKIKGPTQAQKGKNNKGTPESLPPPPPPSAGEESPTAEEESSQNVTTVTNKNTPSGSKMESKAPEPPSEDAAQGQHSHDTDTENSTKNAAAGSPAEPTTSSTSTSGSGDHVQNNAGKDDAQSPEGQHDGIETGNTHVVPTHSETASQTPETATAARINVTTTPGDSDSRTAVSHTTSPLLLLLVACAAAAVVVVAA
ncbi:mucin-associated surface protein (MASP) [Trypanosoma cruzi Dm28c]|uniref:Mucin-associated surface protein (MASP) n=1 Tax=Trypanosoma cruzi Dm28c TaxID=1416333 RepID=V5AMY1_TRYCR|nr:mucin-associated surface protein (MASP) [Trypanosoma cruzi Dm28c]PBJ79629.1 mucin-associated surface protein [Trypanosoma cruzi cruzi]